MATSLGQIEAAYVDPFLIDVALPETTLGTLTIDICGKSAHGTGCIEPMNLKTVSEGPPEVLTTDEPGIALAVFASSRRVRLFGTFSDGVVRNVTHAEAGTEYVSEDMSIAVVDDNGLVEARRIGQTHVIASNGAQNPVFDVVVTSALGDSDLNGYVDGQDASHLVSCLSGLSVNNGWAPTDTDCRIFFDFDADSDLDLRDWMEFALRYTGQYDPVRQPQPHHDGTGGEVQSSRVLNGQDQRKGLRLRADPRPIGPLKSFGADPGIIQKPVGSQQISPILGFLGQGSIGCLGHRGRYSKGLFERRRSPRSMPLGCSAAHRSPAYGTYLS